MTEIDALNYELEQQEKAFNKLHKMYVSLLKQQGELEKENKQLKFELNECSNHKLFSRRELERENKELKTENLELQDYCAKFEEKVLKIIDMKIEEIKPYNSELCRRVLHDLKMELKQWLMN